MENRKLVLKISFGLIAALLIVLVCIMIFQQRIIKQLSANLIYQQGIIQQLSDNKKTKLWLDSDTQFEDESQNESFPVSEKDQLVVQLDEGNDSLKYQLEASEEELDIARDDLANVFDESGEAIEFGNVMNTVFKNSFDSQYENFFSELGLSKEKIEKCKELLVEHDIQAHWLLLPVRIQESPHKEEIVKAINQLENMNIVLDNQMMDLLGTSNFERYKAYSQSID